jgi:hypothetical protein
MAASVHSRITRLQNRIKCFVGHGLNGIQSFQTVPVYLLIVGTYLWLCSSVEVHAQNIEVLDTIKPLHISPDLKKMIRFSGYVHPRNSKLSISDSIKFEGIHTVKRLTIDRFLKMTQAEEDRYNKLMESIYKPLREEQQRIIQSGAGKGTIQYNSKLGYQNPMKMPTELLNENTHTEDKFGSWKEKETEMLKKHERPDKITDK